MADLEQDIATSHLKDKVINSDIYAQNLYAALCNNIFIKETEWSCSWRYAGGLVSEIIDNGGDYLDWYCSGCFGMPGYLEEGIVSDEIKKDLISIGWEIKSFNV